MINMINNTSARVQANSIWVTVKSSFSDEVMSLLLTNICVKGIRFNLSKESDMFMLNKKINYIHTLYPNKRIMIDFGGSKQRIKLKKDIIKLKDNELCVLVNSDNFNSQPLTQIGISDLLFKYIQQNSVEGDDILISDGWQQLRIKEVKKNNILCNSKFDCEIYNQRGISVKGIYDFIDHDFSKDIEKYNALEHITDVAISFTNNSKMILNINQLVEPNINVIAKIESCNGLKNLVDIVEVSDEIMIARGDLLVELFYYGLNILKAEEYIYRCCALYNKPYIIATRIADSLETADEMTFEETIVLYNNLLRYPRTTFLLANETSFDESRSVKNLTKVVDRINMIKNCL